MVKAKKKSRSDNMSMLMKEIPSTHIKVGDIIQLRKGEVCPCDILILNTSDLVNNRYVCSVSPSFSTGESSNQAKFAVSVTRAFGKLFAREEQMLLGLNRLSGTVEYWSFGVGEEFHGTFKLRSDPKTEDITSANLVRKGSVLLSAQVIGLVLFCGNSSLYYRNQFAYLRKKESPISRRVHWYSLSSVVINLIFSLISTMLLMIKASDVTIVKTLDPHVTDGLKLFSFIVLYSPVLPLFMGAVLNLMNAYQSAMIEKKYNQYLYSSNKLNLLVRATTDLDEAAMKRGDQTAQFPLAKNGLTVNNPSVLPSLGCVDEIFFDKTGTLTYNNVDLQSFATRKKIYRSSIENFKLEGMGRSDKETLRGEDYNDSDRSFEGFDHDLFCNEGNISTDDVFNEPILYDFGLRKVLQNPFAEDGAKSNRSATFNDLDLLDAKSDSGKMLANEKFIQTNHKRMVKQFTLNFNQGVTAEEEDRLFDEIEFLTDTRTDRDLKNILQLFTVCHNSKLKNE